MSAHPWPSLWQVAEDKLVKYLLDINHPVGGPKAKFFLNFGFSPSAPEAFAAALAAHPWLNTQGRLMTPPIGLPRLTFEGPLAAPDGREPRVRTVWEIVSDDTARFLTAYPCR
ncbi:DUF6883 domain-containing protein [Methylorubrum suomiense]|uniref:DUF6883 domain-containing protein n=1 Tax=Methylorubrum suomiense TaxID=144191 RepID=A0ABQ4URH5_9HYPH|nr:DUF6883 domain-containing protein [Methylorubrum suomiense]GJE74766.1 hypothetical protein BGCPKDLD_1339 [Methylorubrum suomiense]